MQFQRVSVVDQIDVPNEQQARIAALSTESVSFPSDDPADIEETVSRIRHADALIVSLRSLVSEDVLESNPKIRFIALAGSAFANPASCNVDLAAAERRGITVSTLGQYGDEATAEWVIAMMLRLAAHMLPVRWQEQRRELFGKTLGIVGMGHMGSQVASRAKALGMNIIYWSRSQKPQADAAGYARLPLLEVLSLSDVVSVHVGKGIQAMGSHEFQALKDGVMLINTSIGPVFDSSAFENWVLANRGVVLSDKDVHPSLAACMKDASNAYISEQSGGDSFEMRQRKGDQLAENLKAFLSGSPIRIAPAS